MTELEPQKGFWATVANYDWLKIPGAVRSISRIVKGAGDAGAAWIDTLQAKGEQVSSSIRATTKAREASLEAYTEKAISEGLQDPDLIQRTKEYTVISALRSQQNRESVAEKTTEKLANDSIPEDHPQVDDDWLNTFSEYAGKASTERMRDHWASILADEIRKPGAFSLSSLQLMSVLDKRTSDIIKSTLCRTIDGMYVPDVKSISSGPNYVDLLDLEHIGFLTTGRSKGVSRDPNNEGVKEYFDYNNLYFEVTSKNQIRLGVSILTRVGRELLPILGSHYDANFITEFAEYIKELGGEVKIIQKS